MTAASLRYDRYRDFDLVVNSRLVTKPSRTLFFALRGERRDGHEFIPALIDFGVRDFVGTEAGFSHYVKTHPADVNFHPVDDPASTLRRLAAQHRDRFRIPVIAITGSNGKTIVKDWLTQLLSTTYRVCSSPRSYNSRIGVPLSVWQLRPEHEVAVFEVGISEPGEMDVLRDIVRPTHGVLTLVGQAHIGAFDDWDHLAAEKLRLFRGAHEIVLPADDDRLVDLARSTFATERLVPWSGRGRSGITIDQEQFGLDLPDLPAVYLDNARTAATAACRMGVAWLDMMPYVKRLTPLANRLERREGRFGNIIINDSYSNDFIALGAALEFAAAQGHHDSLTLILGSLQRSDQLVGELRALLDERVDRLILIGDANRKLRHHFPSADYYPDVPELLSDLTNLRLRQQTILIKGASHEKLDTVADALSRSLHRTVLQVDLTALHHNFRTYRNRLPESARIMVMAKASAYGSGSAPVARKLASIGVDYLAVAYPEEGRELREAGIQLPIAVLNAEPYSYPMLAEYRLEPVVYRTEDLRRAATFDLKVHVEVDTGMGRLGYREREFLQMTQDEDVKRQNTIATIFTHLAASDDPVHDRFTSGQLDKFNDLYEAYLQGGGARVQRHVLNTNGISRFPQASYDMVRLGIGIYGLGDDALASTLIPALTLTTTVTAISDRRAGETVGYGRRGRLDRDVTLAVLSIGYADGLPRLAGEGRYAVGINGYLAVTVGAICMDMCTVDITAVPNVRVGDEVTIFGPDHPIELLARTAQTIPYEILTGIGPRVQRVYVNE